MPAKDTNTSIFHGGLPVYPDILVSDFNLKSKYIYLFNSTRRPIFSLPPPAVGEHIRLIQFSGGKNTALISGGYRREGERQQQCTVNENETYRIGGLDNSVYDFYGMTRNQWIMTPSHHYDWSYISRHNAYYTETNTVYTKQLSKLVTNDSEKPYKKIRMIFVVTTGGSQNPKIGRVKLVYGSDEVEEEFDGPTSYDSTAKIAMDLDVTETSTVTQDLEMWLRVLTGGNHITCWYPVFIGLF